MIIRYTLTLFCFFYFPSKKKENKKYLCVLVVNCIRIKAVALRTRDFICVIQLTLVLFDADWFKVVR